ncbi:hypothetical protein RSSM_00361 [Rhodopirellula sallentina SM41]|uniref:Uncharacterized protein n=1 Tax=Rhodopirellula sallentina SM41 TaxID=1263870 RepID=M5U9V0_9BACT|nr:hypothetical protein RSSM_00361 [Rhodopirellula sallentina SM41]
MSTHKSAKQSRDQYTESAHDPLVASVSKPERLVHQFRTDWKARTFLKKDVTDVARLRWTEL